MVLFMDIDQKQEQIIEAAEKLFARFGFRKTTVDEIAKAAGMGKSTLYHYFKSKEEIFAAVIRLDAQHILHRLDEAAKSSAAPQEQFRNYVVTRMTVIQELSSNYASLKVEYLDLYPLIMLERKQFHQQEVDAVTNILQQGVNQGVFTPVDAAVTAKLVIEMLQGLEDQWFMNEQASFHLEHALSMLLDIVLKGIETREK